MALNVNDTAPSFELPDTELKLRTLDEFRGNEGDKKKVIISFFVAASSPVCETELCTFRDSWNEISNLGAQVIAISNDGPFANKAFAQKNNINFPVLADYTSKTIREYDVLMPDLLHIKEYNAAKRSVFIVNEDGKIGYRWVSDDPLKEPNYKEIKDFLKGN
jgi:peroxiredoxin